MNIISIWARDFYDNTIAIDGKIPWHIPSDLKRFKHITEGSTVLMGRKTYESLPYKKLPNRKIIVLTRNPEYAVVDNSNHIVLPSIDSLTELRGMQENLFVAGGASIYEQFFKQPKLKPNFVIDCQIRDVQLNKTLKIYPKERRLCLNPNTDRILKEDYVVVRSSTTKDKFVNTLYIKKTESMKKFIEGIGKNF